MASLTGAVDEQEVYLLILRFLEASPCTEAFSALSREAARHGLLGGRTDWTGASQPTSYARELERRAPSLPPAHLPQLLEMAMRLSREREPRSTRLSVPTLLRQGALSLVEPAEEVEAPDEPSAGHTLAQRLGPLPCTSAAWSALHRRPLLPSSEMPLRGVGGSTARLGHAHALAARQLGIRLPAQLLPPRLVYSLPADGHGARVLKKISKE